MRLCQALARREIALIEKAVAWNRDPVDIAKPAPHAHARTMLGIVEFSSHYSAPPQLREWRPLVLAGAFDVHDGMPRDSALTLQLGTELTRGTEFDVVWKELIVKRGWAAFDDDVVWLQHKPRNHTVFTAIAKQACE